MARNGTACARSALMRAASRQLNNVPLSLVAAFPAAQQSPQRVDACRQPGAVAGAAPAHPAVEGAVLLQMGAARRAACGAFREVRERVNDPAWRDVTEAEGAHARCVNDPATIRQPQGDG